MTLIVTPDAEAWAGLSLADRAYAQVKQLIFDFALLPGDRFSEGELSERIRVSRTPLRQALQRLQGEGFLQVFPKTGWQVAPLNFDTFDQLYDLRILLETHSVALLCGQVERPWIDELAAIWLTPPEARLQARSAVDHLDEIFHSTLVRATGNREMARVHADITERIRIIRRLDFTKQSRVDATYDEHGAILKAIVQRREKPAQSLLRAHIEQSKKEVRHITLDMLYQARQRLHAQSAA